MDDKMNLSTWEQMVEYKKVKEWGRDFNNGERPLKAETLVEEAE